MITASDIKKQALSLGACDKLLENNSIGEFISLMFTSQGREFCKKENFPTYDIFKNANEDPTQHNCFVDKGELSFENTDKIVIVGNTKATVKITDNSKIYKIMLFHGAEINIEASDYSVVLITNIGGSIKTKQDNTARILYD